MAAFRSESRRALRILLAIFRGGQSHRQPRFARSFHFPAGAGRSRTNRTLQWQLSDLNLGVRYEYFSPFSEEDNRIVNLDLPEAFTSPPVPVEVGQTGPYNGSFPI